MTGTRTQRVTLAEIAEEAGVSLSTIRRDLNTLSAEGLLKRVRGGGSVEPDAVPFWEIERQDHVEKDRIAAAAAEMVPDDAVEPFFSGLRLQ